MRTLLTPFFLLTLGTCLLCLLGACQPDPVPSSGEESPLSLEAGFKSPPRSARPRGFWDWLNGNASLPQITYELQEAKAKGMGGFDIWDVGMLVDPDSVVPAGPAFLSEASLHAIGFAVREAERVGMDLGLVISSSWNAGGHWIPAKYGTMGLFRTYLKVEGPRQLDTQLAFPTLPDELPPDRHPALVERDPQTGLPTFYQDVAVLAFPQPTDSLIAEPAAVVDLSDRLGPDGRLQWEVPEGNWQIIRYVCTGTGQPLRMPSTRSMGRMLDHFSREAMKFNLDYLLGKLEQELGSLENRALKYIYTDSYEVNSAAWTPSLPQEFAQRNGYPLTTYLPILDGYTLGDAELSDRFTFDFTKTLSDLIIENHYRFAREYCGERGLGFGAEAGGPGPPMHNVPFEDLKALGSLSVPRGEFWNRHPRGEKHTNELQIIKGIASAAHLYDLPAVEAESFTSVWVWQEGPAELKPLADRALCEGLNRFVYHTFPHTPPEAGSPGWVYNFGTLIHVNNSWWPQSAPFHEYLARASFMLQQGNFVGDVAYYYGDRAPNFVTYKQIPEDLGFGYDYDVVNTEAIMKFMEVQNGRICLPHGQCYEVLVLPDEEAMKLEVLQKVRTWLEAGATVVGRPPQRTHRLHRREERDQQLNALVEELWGTARPAASGQRTIGSGSLVWGQPLRAILQAKGVGPDLAVQPEAAQAQLDFIHRQTSDADIYFLWNKGQEAQSLEVSLRTSFSTLSVWEPLSGEIWLPEDVQATETGQRVALTLPPLASCFLLVQRQPPTSASSVPPANGTFVPEVQERQVLTGEWEVRFPHGWGAPAITTFPELSSWTASADEGIRHFSGIAHYHKTFELEQAPEAGQRIFLNLGDVRELATVYLNGHRLGTQWVPPYRFDLSAYLRKGQNRLQVDVSNVLSNRMVGEAKKPAQYRQTKSNITKGPTPWATPWAELELIPSGLLGPVHLEVTRSSSSQ